MKQRLMKILPTSLKDQLRVLKHSLKPKVPNHRDFIKEVAGKRGLEVGGPSTIFKTILPIYQNVNSLDGANFACSTMWEGDIADGARFEYLGSRSGRQIIADATDLTVVNSNKYDFVLSSNCLEHVANPLKALTEWMRVLKPGGTLVLVLPDSKSNFDWRRPPSPFQDILEHFNADTPETDLSHLEEIMELHDFDLDQWSGGRTAFYQKALNNYQTRTLHHHVFNRDNTKAMLDYVGFTISQTSKTKTDYYWLCRKPA